MCVPGEMRSGGEGTFWGCLGRKHVMLFITWEPVHLLILQKIPTCWYWLFCSPNHSRSQKMWNRMFEHWRCCISLQTDISPAEKLQCFSTVCFKTLVPIFYPLAPSCTVIYLWCNPIRNWKHSVFIILLWWKIQLKPSYFSNWNVFKLTKLCSDIKNIVSV